MTPLDWIIALLPAAVAFAIGFYCRRYVRSVADFMSGGRSAGRYLLAIAGGELQAGAVVFVAMFEMIARTGFTLSWWGWISIPVGIVVGISGFVTYRFRETRAMTLAQFFEIRYSKAFRLFTGVLGFVAGILNFGIIPAVGARCLAYFWGFPETVSVFSIAVPTYVPLMALFLSISLFVALSGGLVTVVVINCLEGIVAQVFYVAILAALLWMFDWSQIVSVLRDRPPGHSLLNPFDSGGIRDFNVGFVLMALVVNIYGTMAWQNAGGYQSAAVTPHEARMGVVLGRWREMGKSAVVVLLGVCALTYLQHPHFAAQSAGVAAEVGRISDPHMQDQMRMPIAVAHLLPAGVKGILCAIFLMGVFGGDATHLHSWGGIFVQDVLVPLRRKPFAPREHLRALRWSMAGVAFFAFLFGALFRQTEYIFMWWSVTTAIYVGGAGAAIIGGLYWRKGTTAGAWTALFTGSAIAVGGIVARQIWAEFPLNGVQVSFCAAGTAVILYVAVSLLTHRGDFDMDRMLHRGKYAVIRERLGEPAIPVRRTTWLGRLVGMDENFSPGDKWIAGGLLGWSLLLFSIFLAGTTWNWIAPWPVAVWARFWHVIGIGLPIFFAAATGIWFTWGGVRGLGEFFRRLREEQPNPLDDGTVKDRRNLDERPPVSGVPSRPIKTKP